MKKLLAIALLAFSFGVSYAQTTALTATVIDSDGTVWANGTWKIEFKTVPGFPNLSSYTVNGSPLSSSVTIQNGTMNGSGVLSATIYDSSLVTPVGSGWTVTVCPNASYPCSQYQFSSAGGSQDISAALSAATKAPRFQPVSGAYGYNDTEAALQLVPGSTYWNVTSSASRCYTGSAWGVCSAGGGSGISGATAGQALIAGSATTATGSKALAGSGAGITTGPMSSTNLDCTNFSGTGGQIADSGAPCVTSAIWNRNPSTFIAPQASDPTDSGAWHFQEPSILLSTNSTACELLTTASACIKGSFTNGWWPVGGGGSGTSICFFESLDGRSAVRYPNCVAANHGRSSLIYVAGTGYVLYATSLLTGQADVYVAASIAALSVLSSPTFSSVLNCGSNGFEIASTTGKVFPWFDGTTWHAQYDCETSQSAGANSYTSWNASSTTFHGPWTKTSTLPTIGYGSTAGGLCVDCGGVITFVSGGKLYAYAHGGPVGLAPTPYIYKFVASDLTGTSWTSAAAPSLIGRSKGEGANLTFSQIANPGVTDMGTTLNETVMLFAQYTNACANQTTCPYPSDIISASINQPLATVLPQVESDTPNVQVVPQVSVNFVPLSSQSNLRIAGTGAVNVIDNGLGSISINSPVILGVGGTPVSDNFARAAGALGANWSGSANITITASGLIGDVTTGSTNDLAWYTGAGLFNDGCVVAPPVAVLPQVGGNWFALTFRQTSATSLYAVLISNTSTTQIGYATYYANGGALTLITNQAVTGTQMAFGDVFKLCVAGNVLTVYRNNVLVVTNTDAGSHVTGQGYPGVGFAGVNPANTARLSGNLGAWSATGLAPSQTGSIGGGALLANACTSGTATVVGATTGMSIVVTPVADPNTPGTTQSYDWYGIRTGTNTVTVFLCAVIAGTPTATNYNVRVF